MQHGIKALHALCLRGGSALQAQLADDMGVAEERLSPTMAGLHHNGYVSRTFTTEGAALTLTEEGRRWLAKQGVTVPDLTPAAAPKPPASDAAAPPPRPTGGPLRRGGSASKPAETTGVLVERRRSRRPKPAVADEEISTDDSGFVTHIKGKAIF